MSIAIQNLKSRGGERIASSFEYPFKAFVPHLISFNLWRTFARLWGYLSSSPCHAWVRHLEVFMTRRLELQDFKDTIQKLEIFLNSTGPEEPIQIIDPEQKLYDFGVSVDDTIAWLKAEIEKEHELEGEALPDEGRRTGALVGE